ncbi:squalene/phytoene synthase family protein [Hankyongella ginsenosidimutans]|uniref:squalene/phytoene synthase family protein n=1 Tax=Hankyongella ginsenosidimutans TaxID=1763828 RepID=UPI001CA330DF|nr:squalene/phytoene synthase family protein [Hankyongella ginsenosidimutans]
MSSPVQSLAASDAPEANSGKGAADENFPVGSFLIASHLRPHVAAFYAFARAADDIADHAELAADDKIARLDALEAALTGQQGFGAGYAKAHRLRESLAQCGVTDAHARALLSAFRQDATKTRYANWAELHDYCRRSADPVGRFLLDLHGEDPALYPASDALCSALQVLNHLQDMGDDLQQIDRCYVALDWLAAAGGSIDDVRAARLSPALRTTMHQMLDATDIWVRQARALPRGLRTGGSPWSRR